MKNNLKTIRKIKHKSQQQIADYLGVNKVMISLWENDTKEKIPPKRAKQLAEFLKIDEDQLFTESLDIESLEEEAIRDVMEEQRKIYLETIVNVFKGTSSLITGIDEGVNGLINEPEKLELIKTFVQVLNNPELENINEKIHPTAVEDMVGNFLFLLKQKDTFSLKVLYMVMDCLIAKSGKRDEWGNLDPWPKYSEFKTLFGELIKKNI